MFLYGTKAWRWKLPQNKCHNCKATTIIPADARTKVNMCQWGWGKNWWIMNKSYDQWLWFCSEFCCDCGQLSFYNVFKAVLIFNAVLKVQKCRGWFSKLFVPLFIYHLSRDKQLSNRAVLMLREFAKCSMKLEQNCCATLKHTITITGFW